MPASRRALLFSLATGLAMGAGPVRAQAGGPVEPIRQLTEALLRAMKAGRATPFAERAAMLGPVIERAFDLDALLRAAVGPRWAGLSAAEQDGLRAAFRRFSIASWVANFDSFDGQRFDISPEPRASEDGARVVETTLVGRADKPVTLSYVMRQGAGGWRVVDVLAEGSISRTAVLRSDFRQALTTGGAAALSERLRAKAEALERGG